MGVWLKEKGPIRVRIKVRALDMTRVRVKVKVKVRVKGLRPGLTQSPFTLTLSRTQAWPDALPSRTLNWTLTQLEP